MVQHFGKTQLRYELVQTITKNKQACRERPKIVLAVFYVIVLILNTDYRGK